MGMSNDYLLAAKNSATYVRIGLKSLCKRLKILILVFLLTNFNIIKRSFYSRLHIQQFL